MGNNVVDQSQMDTHFSSKSYPYNIRHWFFFCWKPENHTFSEIIATVEVEQDICEVDIKIQRDGKGGKVKQETICVPLGVWDAGRKSRSGQIFYIIDPKKKAIVLPSKGVTPVWYHPEEWTEPLEALPTKTMLKLDEEGNEDRKGPLVKRYFDADGNRIRR